MTSRGESGRIIRAAGAVVTRPGKEVLLVHRPKYQDWSFPKGKLDRGEHEIAAAVREVAEETGLDIRLGPRLANQAYPVNGRLKTVSYWVARVVGDDDVSSYRPNAEIDQVRWVSYDRAEKLLSYPHDRETLIESRRLRKRSRAIVVLRHGQARARRGWRGEDRLRPLIGVGGAQARRLVPMLAAFDVGHILSSSSVRCVETLMPYAEHCGLPVLSRPELSEEEATVEGVLGIVDRLLDVADDRWQTAALCTHRPVLPTVWDALQIDELALAPAGFVVVHHRKGRVIAVEHHQA